MTRGARPGSPRNGRRAQAAYILRNTSDPDEVIAFGFFEGDIGALRNDPALQDQIRRLVDAMTPHIESIGADGVYEVVEVVKPG